MQLWLRAEMASSGKLLATEGSMQNKKKKTTQEMLSWPSFSADSCSVGAHPAAPSFPGSPKACSSGEDRAKAGRYRGGEQAEAPRRAVAPNMPQMLIYSIPDASMLAAASTWHIQGRQLARSRDGEAEPAHAARAGHRTHSPEQDQL